MRSKETYVNPNKMKRLSLAIVFTCCTLALAAQDVIKVKYKGAKPTISDFVTAFVYSHDTEADEDECVDESFNAIYNVWDKHLKGQPLDEGQTLIVDEKNGYVCYENRSEYESVEDVGRWEMCYWNESDGKHKLFAYNVRWFRNGVYSPGQFDGLTFYRYDNATKKMKYCEAPGFEARFGNDSGDWMSYELPRSGKDITVKTWCKNGPKVQKLKWNGRKFSL